MPMEMLSHFTSSPSEEPSKTRTCLNLDPIPSLMYRHAGTLLRKPSDVICKIVSQGGKPLNKGVLAQRIWCPKGELNSWRHGVCDDKGRPLIILIGEGQISDIKGAAVLIDALPSARALGDDRGRTGNWFYAAMTQCAIPACIPAKRNAKVPIPKRPAIPPAPQGREIIPQIQRLAPHTYPLHPLCPHLHIRHLNRRKRHLPATTMGPQLGNCHALAGGEKAPLPPIEQAARPHSANVFA